MAESSRPAEGAGAGSVGEFVVVLAVLSGLYWAAAAALRPHLSIGGTVGGTTGGSVPVGFDPLVTLGTGLLPGISAGLLTIARGPQGSLMSLLRRAVRGPAIGPLWWATILLLGPVMYLLTYAVLVLLGRPMPTAGVPWLQLPLLIGYLLLEAFGEELGWTAYLTDPLLRRWGSLRAGVLLGLLTAIWHVVPSLQAHQGLQYLLWLMARDLPWRVLGVWLYVNTGRAVVAVLAYHAMDNLCFVLFPGRGSFFDPAVALPITVLAAALVLFAGRHPGTLTRSDPDHADD